MFILDYPDLIKPKNIVDKAKANEMLKNFSNFMKNLRLEKNVKMIVVDSLGGGTKELFKNKT